MKRLQQKFWDWIWSKRGRNQSEILATGRPDEPKYMEAIFADITEKLAPQAQDDLLDIGCAGGLFDVRLAGKVRKIVATDKIGSMVERASKNLTRFSNVTVLQCDANHIPVPESSFDKVLCYSVIHYFMDDAYLRSFFTEVHRVLRPNGLALIGDVPDKACFERAKKGNLIERLHLLASRKVSRWFAREEVLCWARESGLEARVVSQPPSLPFQEFRFDLLLKKR
jgi:ubiquinone/menaquinone biosynthesis C-methylase UbiE